MWEFQFTKFDTKFLKELLCHINLVPYSLLWHTNLRCGIPHCWWTCRGCQRPTTSLGENVSGHVRLLGLREYPLASCLVHSQTGNSVYLEIVIIIYLALQIKKLRHGEVKKIEPVFSTIRSPLPLLFKTRTYRSIKKKKMNRVSCPEITRIIRLSLCPRKRAFRRWEKVIEGRRWGHQGEAVEEAWGGDPHTGETLPPPPRQWFGVIWCSR